MFYGKMCEKKKVISFFINFSEDQSRLAARKYARVVQKLGFPVSVIELNITFTVNKFVSIIWLKCFVFCIDNAAQLVLSIHPWYL